MAQSRLTLRPRIFLVLIVLLTALRPGDASWVNDEPLMMEMAIRYNHTVSGVYGINLPFTPCPFGLQGTHGARYGPLPVWLDQIFLAFTSNLVLMVALRAILFSSLTVIVLDRLVKAVQLSGWFAVITMLSPSVWLYSRSLWDSTWCIPFSALLLAAYAQFLANPKPAALTKVIIFCVLLSLIHLMGAALVLPILLHLLIFHRERIWAARWRLGVAILVCIYVFWPYLFYFFGHLRPSVYGNQSGLLGWFFPLFGGDFQTLNIASTLPDWKVQAPAILQYLVEIAQWISRGAYTLVWLGMGLAVSGAVSAIRGPRSASVTDHLCLVALSVWICQTILDGFGRVYGTMHYQSGTWCVYALFGWIAANWLWLRIPKGIFTSLIAIYAASVLFGIGFITTTIARNAGARYVNAGTTLGNQIATVEDLRRYSDNSSVDIEVPQWKLYPMAWKVLMELTPPSPGPRPRRHLLVKYRDAYPGDAHIEVEEFSPY